MNLYNEYNRIRRNMLQQARRHNLPTPTLPTAKQLGRRVRMSDIHSINRKQRQQVKLISKKKESLNQITTKIKIPSAKIPKSQAKKSNFKIPKSPSEAYDKYGSRFIRVDSNGNVVDRKNNKVITTTLFATKDRIGNYILERINEGDYKLDEDVSLPTEIELLKEYLTQRIQQAFDEIQSDHRTSTYYQFGGGSKPAIDELTNVVNNLNANDLLQAIQNMTPEEAQQAMERFNSYTDEIRNYIDIALFYTSEYTEGEHTRALDYILDMLQMPLSTIVERDNYDLPDFDLNYGEES